MTSLISGFDNFISVSMAEDLSSYFGVGEALRDFYRMKKVRTNFPLTPMIRDDKIQKKTIAKEYRKEAFNMFYLCASSPKKVRAREEWEKGRKTTRAGDKIEST